MYTNVGNYVLDTSATFAVLIGRWIQDKYADIWNRFDWSETLNFNYTQTLVSGTAEYALPGDFMHEVNCADTTDGFRLKRYTEKLWWEERAGAYSGGTISSGTSTKYVVLRERLITGKIGAIKFDPTPNNTHVIALPYKRTCPLFVEVTGTCTTNTLNTVVAAAETFISDGVKVGHKLKNTTDNTYSYVASVDSETQLTMESDVCPDGNEDFIIDTYPLLYDISEIIEYGATAEALLYKKQHAKAADYLQKYEYELGKRIARENTRPNQSFQWIPESRDPSAIEPFTGWESYNDL